jgi:hypothetical protein
VNAERELLELVRRMGDVREAAMRIETVQRENLEANRRVNDQLERIAGIVRDQYERQNNILLDVLRTLREIERVQGIRDRARAEEENGE